jgi:peroxiredoxin
MKKLMTIFSLFGIIFFLSSFNVDKGYKVGDLAIDFNLKNIDGKNVSMADYKDAKGIILVFTCNSCPFSKLYEDRIIDLHNKYASKGYPVIAVNPNDPDQQPEDSFDNMVIRAKEKKFTFAYLLDASQEIASTYGATRTPHVYLLKKEGSKYRVAYIGAIDDSPKNGVVANKKYVEDAVESLMTGKKVSTNFTKAVGCTIKWKQV